MNKTFLGLMLVAAGGMVAFSPAFAIERPAEKSSYTCPMHPDYVADRSGSCPICGMDLVKKEVAQPSPSMAKEKKVKFYRNPMDPSVTSPVFMKDSMGMDYIPVYENASDPAVGVHISKDQQEQIGVRTEQVSVRRLIMEIRSSGRVVLDQELYTAQQDYLGSNLITSKVWNTSRQKLLILGMSDKEIVALRNKKWADKSLVYLGLTDDVWVYAAVYENEMGAVKPDQRVELTAAAFPGETFQGMVLGVAQAVDPQTRTARVRIKVADKDRLLRPEMSVTAFIKVDMGEKLSVSAEAVMDSGRRKIVHVMTSAETFMPREVVLGRQAGGYVEVVQGLKEGDQAVVSGNFLLDAESRLKGIVPAPVAGKGQ